VRQVTQRNTGRKTAGIDGEVALTPEARAQVAVRVHPLHRPAGMTVTLMAAGEW